MKKDKLEQKMFDSSNVYYRELFNKHGRDPRSLGWTKGRQDIRFGKLTGFLNKVDPTETFTLLDYGCGFGDLYNYLCKEFPNMRYTGVDIMEDFVEQNISEWRESEMKPAFELIQDKSDIVDHYDFTIASGTFNLKDPTIDLNFDLYVEESIKYLESITNKVLAIDFMSPNVDFKKEISHHQDLTRLICGCISPGTPYLIDSTYLPYEFAFFLYKDNKFCPQM